MLFGKWCRLATQSINLADLIPRASPLSLEKIKLDSERRRSVRILRSDQISLRAAFPIDRILRVLEPDVIPLDGKPHILQRGKLRNMSAGPLA